MQRERLSGVPFSLPLIAGLICFVACTNTARSQELDQRTTGPFLCRADFSLAGYESLLAELAQVQIDLTQATGVQAAREPVELYLFSDDRSYRAYLQAHFPQVPYRRALFVKGSGAGRVYVHRSPEMAVDVRHESTHALLHATLPMVPLWLDEGLAEYFEVPSQQRATGNPNRKRLNWKIFFGRAPRLAALEAKRELVEMTETDYSYAWAWVHFMLHGPPEARDELVHFLADIGNNTPPGLLSQRLEQRLPGAESRFIAHFRTWKR